MIKMMRVAAAEDDVLEQFIADIDEALQIVDSHAQSCIAKYPLVHAALTAAVQRKADAAHEFPLLNGYLDEELAVAENLWLQAAATKARKRWRAARQAILLVPWWSELTWAYPNGQAYVRTQADAVAAGWMQP